MEARARTRFDDRGIVIGEGAGAARVPFLAGAMHYWRVDPRWWEPCLRAIADLGLRLVETYVPWGVHEGAGGRYEWGGRRDLGRFLDLVAEVGLGAVVRPGPHVNAELTYFGYPERVLRDPELLARGAHGAPVWFPAPPRAFPVPSYASERFREEVGRWYAAVGEIVAPRIAPAGAVVAVGVDNEAQMFFRLGAFDHDYHPDALAWWGDDDPPRRWDAADAARCIAWVRFKDTYTQRALADLSARLDAAGLDGVARFHNLPPGDPVWSDLPGVERAIGGPAGIDVYTGKGGLAALRRRALHLVGSAATLPIVPECGVGFFPWLPPLDDPGPTAAITLLGAGVRGLSFYMTVGRDRWYEPAITPHGEPGPAAGWIRALVAALAEVEWTSLRRAADVAVVVSRADARWGLASSLVDPVTPVVAEALGLGPGGAAELGRDDAAIAHRRWLDVVQRALDLAQVPYALVDEGVAPERLASFRAIVMPTFDRIDARLLETLRGLADRKHVIVLGPGTPARDELGRPLAAPLPKRIGLMRAGSLDDVAGLAEDLSALTVPPETWTVARGADVDAMALADPAGVVRVVTLLNRSAEARRFELRLPHGAALRDALGGSATAPLPPHGARLLVVD